MKPRCRECGAEFFKAKPWQVYCSYECKVSHNLEKQQAIRDFWREQIGDREEQEIDRRRRRA